MDLKNVNLPGIEDKSIYNCFEQQVMTISYYLYKEYWKLFLENSFQCTNGDFQYIEEAIVINTQIWDRAEKYYGIVWEPVGSEEELTFEEDEIYIIKMNVKDYPFTTKIEEVGEHYFLIYGRSQNGYLVNDNYYKVTDFNLEAELYAKGEKSVYRIRRHPDFKPLPDYKEHVIQKLSCNYHDEIEKIRHLIRERDAYRYHSALLFDKIQIIYSLIKKDILVIETNYAENPYMKECLRILDEVADNIKKVWFSLIKTQLKYSVIPNDKIDDKFKEISHYLAVEKQVKNEIIQLLSAKNSLKERLELQLLEYLEAEEVSDSRSIYEDHEGLAVMLLLNYWEKKNDIIELDYHLYKELRTYGQYKLMTYRNILRGGM
ncbi:hypothetical protein acsn021_17240 [Anaerocolumna cellulosilytica]|uniref:Uncharacterized protein n=1 Tax=Anaerocolumna cellulosilytica TaxID=433286 RepID=A0A6S6R3W0_9FIRM|nr:hypothetical protein [Anaerocolumna cellulosilytica]MBB5194882.1 hypothetical protein [Anaerocolumna cellulosilytica]BCJ94155.1 hypothetical protein acsn021_17240 [Anaerocolumna cellulosilytica]